MMNGRRIPLASVPNAANSPIRPTSNILTKRSRASGDDNPKDQVYSLPPQKKHAGEVATVQYPSQPQQHQSTLQESRYPIYPVRSEYAGFDQLLTQPSRRGESMRETSTLNPLTRPATTRPAERNTQDSSLEEIRQWQKHYKRAFQEYVFYFESLPDDARIKLTRQVRILGSKEERFFSKAVTHVVTTRPIPPVGDRQGATGTAGSVSLQLQPHPQRYQTINPILLDNGTVRSRPIADQQGNSTSQTLVQDENRRAYGARDTLVRARDLGIKIWALEKIQRMMVTMFDTDTGEQPVYRFDRAAITNLEQARPVRTADLSQMLEKEKSQSVKDLSDMSFFRGYYVYVQDQDEKTRPIIVRDYHKPPTKEEGQWPQFRLTGPGRCPFVEDYYDRRAYRAAQESRTAASRSTTATAVTATRVIASVAVSAAGTTASGTTQVHSPLPPPPSHAATSASTTASLQKKRPAVDEVDQPPAQRLRRSARVQTANSIQPSGTTSNGAALLALPNTNTNNNTNTTMEPPSISPETGALAISSRQSSAENLPPALARTAALRIPSRLIRGEPVASGIQPSNITSAIRSQMVSSAAGVGVRGGTSREVHQLQRKVLVQTTSASAGTGPSSFVNEARPAVAPILREAPPPRAAKLKAQESLCQKQRAAASNARKQSSKKKAEAEGKAGYCENCQDKFADFKVHVLTRKHRQFAVTTENWKELDSLLNLFQRASQAH